MNRGPNKCDENTHNTPTRCRVWISAPCRRVLKSNTQKRPHETRTSVTIAQLHIPTTSAGCVNTWNERWHCRFTSSQCANAAFFSAGACQAAMNIDRPIRWREGSGVHLSSPIPSPSLSGRLRRRSRENGRGEGTRDARLPTALTMGRKRVRGAQRAKQYPAPPTIWNTGGNVAAVTGPHAQKPQ